VELIDENNKVKKNLALLPYSGRQLLLLVDFTETRRECAYRQKQNSRKKILLSKKKQWKYLCFSFSRVFFQSMVTLLQVTESLRCREQRIGNSKS
jgi:hypothetical protein